MAHLLSGILGLGRDINKTKDLEDEIGEGVVSEPTEELSLKMPDKELVDLANQWEKTWNESPTKKELERKQLENEKYWLGDHHTPAQKTSGRKDMVDNLVFEALETFLPVATRQNPEPHTISDETEEGRALATKVDDRLKDLADTLRLRLKLKKAARHWALYYLGCIKLGWSSQHNEIAVQVIRPQKLILDPDAITDEAEYEGDYLGEYKTESAENLIARFPKKTKFITDEVHKKLGTKLRYIEWWTPDFLFWKYKGEILAKAKNPHWNYDSVQKIPAAMDDFGNELPGAERDIQGNNHFDSRKIPFAMLSIFNLGKAPVDDTNLIEQVIPLQDVINKRQRQIDKNADSQNSGAVVSGDVFTKEQAAQIPNALRKGAAIWVPRGSVQSAYTRDKGVPLPAFVYESLFDYRNELRNIFGITGLSSQGIKGEDTVRGKIIIRGSDTDRASLIIDHLEQFSDYIFNWMVQLMYVYYDEPHNVSRFQGATTITNAEFVKPLVVSIKEGSLIPKDRLTIANQSVDLATAGKMSLLDLYKNLEYPNPEETAANTWLEVNAPHVLYANDPRIAQVVQQQAAVAAAEAQEGEGGAAAPQEREPVTESSQILSQVPIQ